MAHPGHLSDRELLSWTDGALSTRQARTIETHVAGCESCRTRHEQLARLSAEVAGLLSAEDDVSPALRHRLASALNEEARRPRSPWARVGLAPVGVAAAALMALVAVMAPGAGRAAADIVGRLVARVEHGALPDARLTPGYTVNVALSDICSGRLQDIEHQLPPSVRQQVLRNYGMEHVPEAEYELDYLITPELGGAPDPRNLWPERYALRTWNAKVKDRLEEVLPRLVCEGAVDLETAQREIARDWIAAYKKYVAPQRGERTEIRFRISVSALAFVVRAQ